MGTLVLTGEGAGGDVTVRGPRGEVVTEVTVAAGQSIGLQVPAGEYTVENGAGATIGATVPAGQGARVVVRPGVLAGGTLVGPAPATVLQIGEPPQPKTNWRKPVLPILSAVVPGLGQLVNREYARGAGFLLGSLSLGAVAFALARASGGLDGAAPGEHGRTYSTEIVGAAGLGVLTGGLHVLYMAQLLDAYASATGKRSPTPHTRHKVSLELTRMATVGLRAGDPAARMYADWNVGIVGQVARRFSVGATDLGLKFGPGRAVIQGGVRLSYRFVERGRVWFGGAVGAIVQGAFASGPQPVVPEGTPSPRTAVAAVIPYGQLDLRLFILDRWSINIVPRVSAPLVGARYYRGDGAIPKQAVTLELGTGLGVYF
jgi:hypothetical protein